MIDSGWFRGSCGGRVKSGSQEETCSGFITVTQPTVLAVGGRKLFRVVEWEVLLGFSLTFLIYLATTLLHLVHFSRKNK